MESIKKHVSYQRSYVKQFHFIKNAPCFCNSGQLFGDCCADSRDSRSPPKSLNIVENFLSKIECQRLIRYAEKQKKVWLEVIDSKKSTNSARVFKKDSARVTQRVLLEKKQSYANELFKEACLRHVSSISVPEWYEPPHLLRYQPGGRYTLHSDSEHFDLVNKEFYRFIDRDFSMLIYLNDDFSGGELNFPWLNFKYKPKRGSLVFFPSNHVFSHESMTITHGNKYALVSWGVFTNTLRVSHPKQVVLI